MQATDGKEPPESLTQRISELEALLARKKLEKQRGTELSGEADEPAPVSGEIPILDELVIYDPHAQTELEAVDFAATSPDQLNELIDTIESRLSRELVTLADSLKQTLKQSILEELQYSRSETAHPVDESDEQRHGTDQPGITE